MCQLLRLRCNRAQMQETRNNSLPHVPPGEKDGYGVYTMLNITILTSWVGHGQFFWQRCRSSIAFFHCQARCFASSNDDTFFGVHILKCEEFDTCTLSSLGSSDHMMFPLVTIFPGSTQISCGLSVRINWTFLFVSLFIFFSFDIRTTDSPGSRKSCLSHC